MFPLAWPATAIWTPPSRGDAARSCLTSCSVETLDGPSDGTTWKAIVVPSADVPIGATATTSSNAESCRPMLTCWARTSSCVGDPGRSATTRSGPLTPAPNFSATVVYAWYCVDPEASDEPSGRPSRIDIAGTASAPSTATPSRTLPIARRVDIARTGFATGRGRCVVERGALATVEDALADEAEHGRGEGHRDEHGDRHADRADGAHHAQEGDPGHVERRAAR